MPERKKPARIHKAFDKAMFESLKTKLPAYGITYMPLTEYDAQKSEQNRKKLGLEPISVNTLQFVVLHIHKPYDKNIKYRLTYIGSDSMLHTANTNDENLQEFAEQNGLKLFQYTKRQLKILSPSTYYRFIDKMSAAKRQNTLIRMPDVIAGTPIDPNKLAQCLLDMPMSKIDSTEQIHWDNKNARERHIGNNIAQHGTTVEQYIQIRYAYMLISEFHKATKFMKNQTVPKAYQMLEEQFSSEYDNWTDARLKPKTGSKIKTPDPNAYEVLTKINTPTFEREPGNKNKSTFDRIRITMGIKSKNTLPNRKEIILKYKHDIVRIALIKIENYTYFNIYGVPIQCIKPTEMTISRDDQLEIIFELKI